MIADCELYGYKRKNDATMKAAVMRGTQQIAVEDVPTPEPGPNQVLLNINYSAICG